MMEDKRGRAFRRWKTFVKYVAKIRERMSWYINDSTAPPFGRRHPKDWKEMDTDGEHIVKQLKKTATKWSSKWEDYYDKTRNKKIRQANKKLIDEELNNSF